MTELAFLIFAVVGLVSTAKIWKPWLQYKADELEVVVKDATADLQGDLFALSQKIDGIKEQHGGKWYTMEDIEAKMK